MKFVLIIAALAAFVAVILFLKNKNKRKTEEILDTPSDINEDNKITEQEVTENAEDEENIAQDFIDEQKKIATDAQIRYFVEKKLIPSKLNDDPIYIITSIIAEKGRYINNFYKNLYAKNNLEVPYADEDFVISKPFEVEGAMAVKVEMPEKNLFTSICKRVYIVYNKRYTKHLYLTVEQTEDGQLKLFSHIDSEREEIGLINNNEEELVKKAVLDEEICEEKYSDVLDKLMENATEKKSSLLTDMSEIQKHSQVFMNTLIKAQKEKQEGKRDEALKLIKELIRNEAVKYTDTPDKEYHSFRSTYELLLYANLYHPYNPDKDAKKQLDAMQVDLASAYLVFGAMMLEQRQYDKAIEIFYKGLEANPVNLQLLFALADSFGGKKYLKSYMAILKRAHICAYKRADIARIYRGYAHYYANLEQYDLAVALAYAGKYFDNDIRAFEMCMSKIKELSKTEFGEPDLEEIKRTLLKNEIAWGAKELSVSVINLMAKQFEQAKNEQGIKACNEMMKELTL